MERRFDLAVIGGGPGGYTAAIQAAKLGLRTALVEARELGGTCLNRGCIPTKAMLHAAELFRTIQECGQFGISVTGAKMDFQKLLEYRNSTVEQLVQGVEQLLSANGVEALRGRGTLLPDRQVRVSFLGGDTSLSAEYVLLATGSRPKRLPILGMELPGVLDSDGLFALEELPEQIIIIGGGAIGVELAGAFSAGGAAPSAAWHGPGYLPEPADDSAQAGRRAAPGSKTPGNPERRRGTGLHL